MNTCLVDVLAVRLAAWREGGDRAALFSELRSHFALAERRFGGPDAVEHLRGRGGRRRIASMACGPAVEMADLVRESSFADDAELLCIDQDPQALACAREGVDRSIEETGAGARLSCVNDSVRGLLKSKGADPGGQDFLYSLGLFDYLPDRPAQAFAAVLYRMLAPGGGS